MIGRSGQPPFHSVVDLPLAETRNRAVEMTLPARPENIAVIRHLLGALGDTLRLDSELLEDLRLAVTEASTNVVRHAYGDQQGTIELEITPTEDGVRVVVGDRGRGLGPSPDTRGPGLGLPLIAALADSVEIELRAPGTGSRVAMSFARRRQEAAA